MDPTEGAVLPWLERHTPSNSTQRGTGAVCKGVCAHGIHTLDRSDCGVPSAMWRENSQFLLQGMCALHWIHTPSGCLQWCPGAICWSSGLRGPMCWSGATTGTDASGQGCALQQLREAPRGCLPGQWAQGSCVLDRCDCSDQSSAAEEGEVRVSVARALSPLLDMSVPSGSSQRHSGVACWGGGLRGPAC